MKTRIASMVLISVLSVILLKAPVCAESKPIALKYAGLLPPGTTLSQPVNDWGALVEERTQGQVKLTTYHAQALGKYQEYPKMMSSGLCEMAFVAGGTPGFELLSVAELPSLISSMRVSMDIMHALYRKGLLAPVFEKNGVKLMFFMNSDPRMIWFSKKKVTKISDFKELKIRGLSPVHIDVAKALGASVVSVSPTDVFMAMERGTVDGIMSPSEGIFALKLYETIKYCLWEPFTTDMSAVVMSLKMWDSLPSEVKIAILNVNEEMKYRYIEYYKTELEDIDRVQKAGIEIVRLDPEQKKIFNQVLEPVSQNWLAKMEEKGVAVKAVYEEFARLKKQYE